MCSKRFSVALMIKMALLLPALPVMVGCSGGSGGSSTNDNTNDNGNDNGNNNNDNTNGNGNDNGSDDGVVDPAPNNSTPGEFGCEGCPDSDASGFEVVEQASSRTFGGTVTGADGNGEFYVQGESGEAIGGTIATDSETGAYSFTVPLFCGEQLVKCVWSNAAGSYVLVTRVIFENCVTADIRITLTWDGLGQDWELHLIKPGGRINDDATDCTWTSCISESPDWGVQGDASDDPSKDVDNVSFYGPENIFLANPESGTYTVLVEHWGSGDPNSDGQVVFNVGGQTVSVSIQDLAPREVWTAGTIEWPSGTVVTGTEVFDCADNWSSGCQADIP